MNRTYSVLLALVAGLVIGAAVAASGNAVLAHLVSVLEPLGVLWTNAIRMTVVPLVVALVVTGVAGATGLAGVGRLGARAVPLFLLLLVGGGVLAVLLATPAMHVLAISPETASALREGVATGEPAPALPSVAQRIVETIPVNPIRAAADAAMLPLVVFSLMFAVALATMPVDRREPVVSFFRVAGDAMLVIVRWVLAVAPVGIFALALGLGLRMGVSAAGALLHYVVVLSSVLLVYIVLLYPVVRLTTGIALRRFAAAAAPAQGIALSSRSSLAALPAIISGTRDQLGSPAPVTGFAMPLAVSVFRPNVPMAWVVAVLFLGKLYGIDVGVADLVKVVAVATFLSFSVPGIPSASLFLLAPLLGDLGMPAAGAGILIAVDAIPDMFKTSANVTSHVAVAAMLGKVGMESADDVS